MTATTAEPAPGQPHTSTTTKADMATDAAKPEASAETEAAPACEFDPSADFQGDLPMSQDLPTQADLDKCADMLVLGSDGESRPFKSLYSGEGVASRQLIIFVRHFFCGNCQEYLRTLSASITPDALLALPTPTFITVVGCGRPELISMYASTTGCPFPIFADPTTKLYSTLGMTRTLSLGAKPNYIKSSFVQTTVQSIFQGIKSGRGAVQGGDFRQVGGEMLFEDGRVTWVHRMKNTRDHAEIEELRKVLGLKGVDEGRRKSGGLTAKARRSVSWHRKTESDEEREEREKESKRAKRRTIAAPETAKPE